jgi:hypothetical protein
MPNDHLPRATTTRVAGDIIGELERNWNEIRSFGVRRLALFGSQARGEATAESDLDFVVEFRPGEKTFDRYMDLVEFLKALFDCNVDLVPAETIKPRLKKAIESDLVYASGP